jgi:hypothetical protein
MYDLPLYGRVIFCRPPWYSADGPGYHPYVSNGNAAAAVMLTVAVLTGMSHVQGGQARRHVTTRHWSSPERVELGDAEIPVRTVRTRTSYGVSSRPRIVHRDTGLTGKSQPEVEETPEVIVGYVDPGRGRTAFHRLARVAEGDRVKVVRRDHSVAWFKVDSVRRMARGSIGHSGDEVRRSIARERAASGGPELRLVSWRGRAKRAHGDAPANVVVSAHLDRPDAHLDRPAG